MGFRRPDRPILVARAKDMTGSFAGTLPLIALLLLVAVILPCLTRKPALRPAQRAGAESCRGSAFEAFDTAPATGEFR
jgi:hypothetical protein